ncbi:MAG: 4-hydroxy-tetrahydrodipicolinate reductase [Eggerthellaceae bacterium]|nr:4-hydroxy-tetrahydrodipicolinate reductase [Eggerthellaceae bacterium]
MIKVAVAGCNGKMGKATLEAVTEADDMALVCGIDPKQIKCGDFEVYPSITDALAAETFDVLVDFTQPDQVGPTVEAALTNGVNCVVGTTGLSNDELEELSKKAVNGACLFYASNFTIGAVLMMKFAEIAAPYFPEVEIIEYHHADKKDAPSGTAIQTAHRISAARKGEPAVQPAEAEQLPKSEEARGKNVDGIPIHSVRCDGFVAKQDVIFGSMGQTLLLRHDSWGHVPYTPGILMAIRAVIDKGGLIIGLESIM